MAPLRDHVKYQKHTEEVEPHSYLVELKRGVSADNFIKQNGLTGTYQFHPDLFNGFSGYFPDQKQLETILNHRDVVAVSEDAHGVCHGVPVWQKDASWALARTTRMTKLWPNADPADLDYMVCTQSNILEGLGKDVDIYILDTGVRTTHSEFAGRIRWGANFVDKNNTDTDGHGTHCASLAAGSRSGWAKRATIIAVKIIAGKTPTGKIPKMSTRMMQGFDFVFKEYTKSKRRSVISISNHIAKSDATKPLMNAVQKVVNKGIVVVASAGNDATWKDSKIGVPARLSQVITVGATNIRDEMWISSSIKGHGSNYGPLVDVWAPGDNIPGAGIANDQKTAVLSGTSMATPLVAGMVACLGHTDKSSIIKAIKFYYGGKPPKLKKFPADDEATEHVFFRNPYAFEYEEMLDSAKERGTDTTALENQKYDVSNVYP